LFVLANVGGGYLQLPVIKLLKHDTNIQQDNIIFIDFCGRVTRIGKISGRIIHYRMS